MIRVTGTLTGGTLHQDDTVAVEPGAEQFGAEIVSDHRSVGLGRQRAVEEPVLLAALQTVSGSHVRRLDLKLLGHGQLPPGDGLLETPRLQVQNERGEWVEWLEPERVVG